MSVKKPNVLLYQSINNEWDEWYIELYELYPCKSREELCKREGEVIREIATLNKNVAGRNVKEWYIENTEGDTRQRYYRQVEYLRNKLGTDDEYRAKFYEKKGTTHKNRLETDAEYKRNHNEYMREYMKQYRKSQKDYYRDYMRRRRAIDKGT